MKTSSPTKKRVAPPAVSSIETACSLDDGRGRRVHLGCPTIAPCVLYPPYLPSPQSPVGPAPAEGADHLAAMVSWLT